MARQDRYGSVDLGVLKENILVVGGNHSGAGALLDLLSEYDGITRVPGEFDDFRRSGLIGDVISGLASVPDPRQSNYVLKDFRCYSPFDGPRPKCYFRYYAKTILYPVKKYHTVEKRRKFFDALLGCSARDRSSAISAANEYINWCAQQRSGASRYRVFAQPIFLGVHDEIWPECFSPFKAIFVKRNPFDQIFELSRQRIAYLEMDTPIKTVQTMYGTGLSAFVNFHSDAILARYRLMDRFCSVLGDDRAMLIDFEDLVRDYDVTKRRIEDFLGLSEGAHARKRKKLNPERSISNIGVGKSELPQELVEKIKSKFQLT